MKIGAGPIPIRNIRGLAALLSACCIRATGYVYSFGSAAGFGTAGSSIYRSGPYLISPQMPYECMGDVPNVCFPCAELHDPATAASPFITAAPTQSRPRLRIHPRDHRVYTQNKHYLIKCEWGRRGRTSETRMALPRMTSERDAVMRMMRERRASKRSNHA